MMFTIFGPVADGPERHIQLYSKLVKSEQITKIFSHLNPSET